jgi:peroxiredoxin
MTGKWLTILFLAVTIHSSAQTEYEIKVTLTPFKTGYLYLAHHFGTKQYLIDSAALNSKSEAVFRGNQKLFGGVYMIVFPAKNGWMECIIDKETRFEVIADSATLVESATFKGSADNVLFSDYQKKSFEIGTQIADIRQQLSAPGGAENKELQAKAQQLSQSLQLYRENFLKEHPEHLLSAIFKVLKEPVIPPADKHPGGKYDSLYAYHYYKAHYWDGVSFADERLLRTPVFQPKLDRYYNEILPQVPDTIIVAADNMLQAAKSNPEMFKFLLSTFTDKYVNPTYMGQDAVFVHLFQKYYLTGMADSWMTDKYKKFINDRGYSLMSNVIGKKGSDFEFLDTTGKKRNLYGIQSEYTVICFWDPTCSHCKEEVPKLDSLFQSTWKKQGITLLGVMTDGGKEAWLKYIRDNQLKGWLHVYQTQAMKDADYAANKPGVRQLYDVYQTPMLYLLDRNKNIIAKKLNYQQLAELLQVKTKTASVK